MLFIGKKSSALDLPSLRSWAKLFHPYEWVTREGKTVTLLDYLSIQQCAIVQEHIGQGPLLRRVVFVTGYRIGRVKLQPYTFALDHVACELACLFPEPLYGFLRVLGLGSIDANEPHALTACKQQCIAIDNPLYNLEVA